MRILRIVAACERCGISRSTLLRLEATGAFPKRVRLGVNAVGWIESEIDAWIERRAQERDDAAAA